MREYLVKTKKVGDQIVIVLPKELLAVEQIGADATVKITVQKIKTASTTRNDTSLGPEDPWKLLE
ncbi:MAG: hypothetical protein ACQCN6_02755 [Candidatus Bathyarchaeia archaeon]|jgi:FKBP-type peptidyl-prolyl cis-trans isomerase (trigger factor)